MSQSPKWVDDNSTDGQWRLIQANVLNAEREIELCRSENRDGGPPFRGVAIFNTRREAKAYVKELVASGRMNDA